MTRTSNRTAAPLVLGEGCIQMFSAAAEFHRGLWTVTSDGRRVDYPDLERVGLDVKRRILNQTSSDRHYVSALEATVLYVGGYITADNLDQATIMLGCVKVPVSFEGYPITLHVIEYFSG